MIERVKGRDNSYGKRELNSLRGERETNKKRKRKRNLGNLPERISLNLHVVVSSYSRCQHFFTSLFIPSV